MKEGTMLLRDKLKTMGIELPSVSGPFGSYVPAKRVGNLIYVAGQLPMKDGQLMATGPVPSECSQELATAAAKQCVINALAAVNSLDGGIDQIKGVARVGAFVSSDNNFAAQPQVANGASDFLLELFGDAGKHARAAVGVNVLPRNGSVEIEIIFEA
jgi:enamine deaminase RidA (YjgF/YER057c/UK114 family)